MKQTHNYSRIIAAAMASPWAILPAQVAVIREILMLRAAGEKPTAAEIDAAVAAGQDEYDDHPRDGLQKPQTQTGRGVMVLSLVGVVIPRYNIMSELSGSVSVQRFTERFREALADDDVGAIVIDVDSPGGQVTGVAELAREIYEARNVKPIIAVANGMAASAAYWLASAAGELVVTPTGDVGSIGVFTLHQDVSGMMEQDGIKMTYVYAGEFKVEGNPFEPLGDDARAYIQTQVNRYYDMFAGDVGKFRQANPAHVVSDFGRGRMVDAETAVALGMADRVATLDDVVNEWIDKLSVEGSGNGRFGVQERNRRLTANSR